MLEPLICPSCGTELATTLLTCPSCRRLVHADRLKGLVEEAERAEVPTEALAAYRSALELLPTGSRQHAAISARIVELGKQVEAGSPAPTSKAGGPAKGSGRGAGLAGLGTLALVGWKLKTVGLILLTKGKLLLLGLTKMSTLTSMFLAVGVYWTAFGWRFALGLVVSIYIHEMGHVAALLRYGIKASAPLFIPGLGAIIRLRQSLGDPRQDARVGLAGPTWGLGAALAAYLVWLVGGSGSWLGIAKFGAWINLFNLLPLGSLDGGRAFRSLTRPHRWLAVLAIASAWSFTTDGSTQGILTLLLLVGILFSVTGRAAVEADRGALLTYAALVIFLSLLSGVRVDVPAVAQAA